MKKLTVFFIILILIQTAAVHAIEIRFGWNIGNFRIYYDPLNNEGCMDIEVLHFNWLIDDHFFIGLNAMEFNFEGEDDRVTGGGERITILPLEIAFVPFGIDNFAYFSIYGKAGWQLVQDGNRYNHDFYGSVGTKMLFFLGDSILYYSPIASLFVEYEFLKNSLKIGGSLDLLIFLAAMGEPN